MTRPVFALLPLDDRPPNLQFPRRLAALADLDLRLPPKRLLGRFLRPGEPEGLWQWMEEAARDANAVVVSADMLAYGGLIASRTTDVTRRQAIRRVLRLRRLKRRRPHLRVYVFAVIPRLGLTISSPRLANLGPALARYLELRARPSARLGAEETAELARLRGVVPAGLITQHADMRQRNLAVNKQLVALLAAEGALDFLVLAQEDAPPSGPHVHEQAELSAEAMALGAAHLASIFPGADEQGMVLLARAAGEALGARAAVYPLYSTPGGAEAVALFEDRPLRMTVAGQIGAAGLGIARTEQGADMVLGVHPPPGPTQADINHITPASAPPPLFIERLARLARSGRHTALADVAYCNGADPALVAQLAAHKALPLLAGFAAWNTAGNSIGSALAQAALRRLARAARSRQPSRAGGGATRAQVEFLFERLIDDYAYQTVVRREACRFARENLGQFPLHLRRGRRRAGQYVRAALEPLARRLFAEHFEGAELDGQRIAELRDLRIGLPWPRLFEVEVEAKMGLK
jgi:hypothetical protein